jgi:hypothetical protein
MDVESQTVDLTVYVDGEAVTIDTMTFRERREVRRVATEVISEDPESEEYNIDDAVMALIAVAKQRKDPGFDPLQMLDEKLDEYLKAPPTSNGGTKSPSRSAAPTTKPKTKATS